MKQKQLKALDGFSAVSDADVIKRGTNVQTNLTGNSRFPNPPVDLAVLKAALDLLAALVVQALDGSKRVIAEKNKQRETVIQMLRLLARYVEVVSNNDKAIFQTSGFEAALMTKAIAQPLSEKIRKIERGDNSGEVAVWMQTVRGASSYELRYGASVNGAAPATWATQGVTTVRTPVTIAGLTPATTYMFQARALAKNKYTDWSDSVTFVCG